MLKIALISLLIVASAVARETTVPDTLALNDADAQTCKVHACRTITDGAYDLIAMKVQQLEERNARLAAALAKKPNPKFCL
jgi:hypothetical protein